MSPVQRALIELAPGERTWIGRFRVTRLRNGDWLFWSKVTHRISIFHSLPEAARVAERNPS